MSQRQKRYVSVLFIVGAAVVLFFGVIVPACGSDTSGDCPKGQILCGETCTVAARDPSNCGLCGTVCPAGTMCSSGMCATSCQAGFSACKGGAGDYCARLADDEDNCGTCGTSCGVGGKCKNGACCTLCGGDTCSDLATDANNCGGCGIVCPGGACMAGKCACAAGQVFCAVNGNRCTDTTFNDTACGAAATACSATQTCVSGSCVAPATFTTLTNDGNPILLMAKDATTLYYTEPGRVMKLTVSPTPAASPTPVDVVSGATGPIAVDATNVFFSASNSLFRIPLAGGTALNIAPTNFPVQLALDATNVYWVEENNPGPIKKSAKDPMTPDGGVPDSGGLSAIPTILTATDGPNSLGVDGNALYFSADTGIWKVPIAGGLPKQLYVSNDNIEWMVMDANFIYGADEVSPGIVRVSKNGGAPVMVVASVAPPKAIAVDEQNIYWTEFVNNAVRKQSLCGGPATTLAVDPGLSSGSFALLVDATKVYWGTQTGIHATAK